MPVQLCTVKGCYNLGRYCRIPGHTDVRIKPTEPIARYSPKREGINQKQYIPKQKAFLKTHPFCELKLEGCTKMAQGVHHVEGKETIEKLLNEKEWKAACNPCNGEAERKDAEARDKGLKKTKHKPNYQRIK